MILQPAWPSSPGWLCYEFQSLFVTARRCEVAYHREETPVIALFVQREENHPAVFLSRNVAAAREGAAKRKKRRDVQRRVAEKPLCFSDLQELTARFFAEHFRKQVTIKQITTTCRHPSVPCSEVLLEGLAEGQQRQ